MKPSASFLGTMMATASAGRSHVGKVNIFCGAKSTCSAILRVRVSVLVLGLLYQTCILHDHFSNQSEFKKLRSLGAQRLDHFAESYDQETIYASHHLDLGPSVSHSDYSTLLEKAAKDAFSSPSFNIHPAVQRAVAAARSAVTLFPEDGWPLGEIPTTVSTSIRNVMKLPHEFHGCEQQNSGWRVNIYDDAAIESWVNEYLAILTESGLEELNVLRAFKGLPRPVLKSDMFRYLRIFLEGGVYADTDTSSVVPVSQWGKRGTVQDWTDSKLLELDTAARNLTLANDTQSPHPLVNERPPALIVAIETQTKRDDSEGGHLVQYAFAGAPGHPVLLDVLQHIVEVSRAVEGLRAAGDNKTWNTGQIVYTWTGPEVWSSAVWRYLWALW